MEVEVAVQRWKEIATFAYRSFLSLGPGVVRVDEELTFHTDFDQGPSTKLLQALESYDPAREVLVAFSGHSSYIHLKGSSINTPRILFERSQLPDVASEDRVAHAFTRYKRRRGAR